MNDSKPKRGRPRDEELASKREEEILREAAVFFAEFGYRQADIQILANRLGIGKGTVYRYFPTKEKLFFAAVDAAVQGLTTHVMEAYDAFENPVDRLSVAIRSYLGYCDEHPELVELLIVERAEFRNRQKSTYFLYKDSREAERLSTLSKAMDDGYFRRMPVERLSNFIGDCLYGVIFTNHFSNRKIPFNEQADDVIDIIMNGLLPKEADA